MADLMQLIITGLLVAVLLGALIGTITDETIGRQGVGNVTGATSVMLGLVPIFLLIAVILGFVSLARIGRK